jgi:GT2 family glycosyltransferase
LIDVSVIIVNWNTAGLLRDCLASVYGETRGVDFEVIVVDNASSDRSQEMVGTEFPQVTLIENAVNTGFAAANNQGMKAAQGRYVLLLNSDTVILDGAIQKMVAFADARPETGVAGCRVENRDGSLQPTCFMFPSITNLVLMATHLYKLFPRSRFFGRALMSWWDRSDEREVEVVTGCFMLVRREVIECVGGFDEAYFFTGEEADWCRRIAQAGWKLVFTPSARIIHLDGATARTLGWRIDALQTRGTIQLFRSHYGALHARIAAMLLWTFNFTHMLVWRVEAALPGARRQAARQRYEHFREIVINWNAPLDELRRKGVSADRDADSREMAGGVAR